MNNYLDNYGVVDARREKRWKRIIYSLLTIAVVGGALWFFLRNYKEESRVREFLALSGLPRGRCAIHASKCKLTSPGLCAVR